jgi:hypothetical protein
MLSYLTSDQRTQFVGELERLGRSTDLTWLFAESPGLTDGLPFPDHLTAENCTVLMLARWRDGRCRVDHLGSSHPHGSWLHWADA